jgi:hypothetical protein
MINCRFYALLLLAAVSINCHRTSDNSNHASNASEQSLTIQKTQSPTDGDSREPELTATPDGRIILSWVERLSEKRYALRAAVLDQDRWSEPRTVSEGENWFINWADFPSIVALKDGSLAAHWLVKSSAAT